MRSTDRSSTPLLVVAATLLLGGCGDRAPSSLPAGDVLLASASYGDRVHVLHPELGREIVALRTDPREDSRDEPSGLAIGPRASTWYVAMAQGEPALWVFDAEATEPTRTIPLHGMRNAARVAVSPDGRTALVTEYWLGDATVPGQIAAVDLASGSVSELITPCPTPYAVAYDPGGERVAVSCPLADAIVVLDATTLEIERRFSATTPEAPAGSPGNPGSRPMDLAWAPGGDRIHVSLFDEGRVASFTPDGAFAMGVEVGRGPLGLEVVGLGRYVVVATRDDPGVAVVDTRTRDARRLPLPDAQHPHAVAVRPDGRVAFVTYEGSPSAAGGVMAVDLDAGEVLWRVETGPMTTALAFRPGSGGTEGEG